MTSQELMDYQPVIGRHDLRGWFVEVPSITGGYTSAAGSESHAKRIRTGWRNGVMDHFHGVPRRNFCNMQSAEMWAYDAARQLAEASSAPTRAGA